MRCIIREMEPSDFPKIIMLLSQLEGVRVHPSENQEWHNSFIVKNKGLCFIASMAEQIVGCIYCGNDGRRATIYHLGVMREHQLSGVGRKLMETLEKQLKSTNIKRAQLVVVKTNQSAIQFYIKNHWQLREDLAFMVKDLD